MKYVVKRGHKAFIDGSMQGPGYVHEVDTAYEKRPAWAEEPGAKKPAPEKPKKLPPHTKKLDEEDIFKNPTVQL